MDFIDAYERHLVRAAGRRARAVARRRRRRIFAVAVVLPAIAAPALAATHPWSPNLGDSRRGHPNASEGSVPANQAAAFAVLRRPQRASDRGPATAYALRLLTRNVDGVRLGSVRLLTPTDDHAAVVLVPVDRFNVSAPPVPHDAPKLMREQLGPGRDGLCLFEADYDHGAPAGGGFSCLSTGATLDGFNIGSLGRTYYQLVPDPVSRVMLRFRDRDPVTATVSASNLATVSAQPDPAEGADAAPQPIEAIWYDARGHVLKRIPLGAP